MKVEHMELRDEMDIAQGMVLVELYCCECAALHRFRWPERENALVRTPPQIMDFNRAHRHAPITLRPLVQEAA